MEGLFYTFTHEEFTAVVGEEHAAAAALAFGVTPEGNFEGTNVLTLGMAPDRVAETLDVTAEEATEAIEQATTALRTHRQGRVRPGLDDKAVCAWNAHAIRAFAEAAVALEEPSYLDEAETAARWVLAEMRRADGRLLRSRRRGRGDIPAFAEDYAALAVALFALYEASGDTAWYEAATSISTDLIDLFWDDDAGGVFATGIDAEDLVARPKNLYDNPTPSDNALAAEAMLYLTAFTGDPAARDRLDRLFRLGGRLMAGHPQAAGHLLAVAAVALSPPRELAIVGPPDHPVTRSILEVVAARYRPDVFVARGSGVGPKTVVPLLAGRSAGETALAYLCREFVCESPTADPATLADRLDS